MRDLRCYDITRARAHQSEHAIIQCWNRIASPDPARCSRVNTVGCVPPHDKPFFRFRLGTALSPLPGKATAEDALEGLHAIVVAVKRRKNEKKLDELKAKWRAAQQRDREAAAAGAAWARAP